MAAEGRRGGRISGIAWFLSSFLLFLPKMPPKTRFIPTIRKLSLHFTVGWKPTAIDVSPLRGFFSFPRFRWFENLTALPAEGKIVQPKTNPDNLKQVFEMSVSNTRKVEQKKTQQETAEF